jgi:solute carrier family 45 protein 1/2/4
VQEETSPLLPSPGSEGKGRRDEVTSAGAIMGLHNVFISSPQFISTLLASIIFHFLGAGGRGDDIPALSVGAGDGVVVGRWTGGGSIAWVLRVGGLGAVYAAYLTWKLAEEIEI